VERPLIGRLARRLGVYAIADATRDGRDAGAQIARMLEESIAGLRRGESLLLYPAGRAYRQRLEDLGGNSAVEWILGSVPDVRVVLVRSRGLWGSGFSYASGRTPSVGRVLRRGLRALLASGLCFAPRRRVTLEFCEPEDLPRSADRATINRYLEHFYNQDAEYRTYVPYSVWERGGPRRMPEPGLSRQAHDLSRVPATTRKLVLEHLRERTGVADPRDEHRLAHDLGLDSLGRVELQTWIEAEFGFAQADSDVLETVGDVLLAASGEALVSGGAELKPVERGWFKPGKSEQARPLVPPGDTITEVFLRAARRDPDRVIVADQTSGARTYRDLITAVLVLKPLVERLEGDYLGIMLPASVAADIAYLTALFAGKTPVMLNWTVGPRGVQHCLEQLDIQHVLSASRLVKRLRSEGFGEASSLLRRLLYLDQVAKAVSLPEKIGAALRARLSLAELERAPGPRTAVVLFTSGSESHPKAVPLSHTNLLVNIRDALEVIPLYGRDALLGMLPPFHSFGLTVGVLLPLLSGLRVAHHPNPTEASVLASLIDAYQLTALVGTPTFLGGICRAATDQQLRSLRLCVTGAEACPARIYQALADACPQASVLEGYGITECSPVVSVNRPGREKRETIGELLPSVEGVIVDPESGERVQRGERGMLLVRGPSVFGGYLKYEGASPFVEYAGQSYYRSGDLVTEDADGVLTFRGRLKRFVKLGGEMISLPAIEAVLEGRFAPPDGSAEGPVMAVESTPSEEHPELVLFTTLELEREAVNRALREAGLSPLHNVRRVQRLDALPLLGTGKTDYVALRHLAATAG
jgi:long-chain-fatty-acid--[acyl-carrier-protein] ligase